MKKLLSLALIASLLLSSAPMHAKHHSHKHAGNKVLSGAWQFVKIGGGLFMFVGGILGGTALCGCGFCIDQCDIAFDGTGAKIAGGVVGVGGTFLGFKSIRSGVRGLRRLAHQKNKKKHKRHIHATNCS